MTENVMIMTNESPRLNRSISNDPLAVVITAVVDAMHTDYPQAFASAYKTDEDIRQLKRRLYSLLRTINPAAVADGYDACVQLKPGYLPTVPEIASAAYECDKSIKAKERNALHADAVAALPNPNAPMPVNVRKEFERVMENRGKTDMETLVKRHEELIRADIKRQAIRIPTMTNNKCAVGGCEKTGVLSHSTTGGANFYCAEHFR